MPVSRQAVRRPITVRRNSGRPVRSQDVPREGRTERKRVIVVGVSEAARSLVDALSASVSPKYEIVGHLAEDGAEPVGGMRVLGNASQMFELADSLDIDEVIVASVPSWIERLAETISTSANGHPKIRLVPNVYETMVCYPKLARVHDLPLVTLNYDRPAWVRVSKRLFDVVFASAALVVSAPVMACAALLMKLTSGGPVFYRQPRVGLHGKEFMLFKLRTMVVDAERDTGPVLSSPTDDRVTRVGRMLRRVRIDELPQFLNVLKGDMSVVGPRPERLCFVDQFSKTIPGYAARHQIRPGITGLAQVYGGYTTDPETKLKYDLMYVYGGSLLTDLKVLVLTLPVMVKGA